MSQIRQYLFLASITLAEIGSCIFTDALQCVLLMWRIHCYAGFTGRQCETLMTSCAENTCHNGGTCSRSLNGSVVCACAAGYGGPTCSYRVCRSQISKLSTI